MDGAAPDNGSIALFVGHRREERLHHLAVVEPAVFHELAADGADIEARALVVGEFAVAPGQVGRIGVAGLVVWGGKIGLGIVAKSRLDDLQHAAAIAGIEEPAVVKRGIAGAVQVEGAGEKGQALKFEMGAVSQLEHRMLRDARLDGAADRRAAVFHPDVEHFGILVIKPFPRGIEQIQIGFDIITCAGSRLGSDRLKRKVLGGVGKVAGAGRVVGDLLHKHIVAGNHAAIAHKHGALDALAEGGQAVERFIVVEVAPLAGLGQAPLGSVHVPIASRGRGVAVRGVRVVPVLVWIDIRPARRRHHFVVHKKLERVLGQRRFPDIPAMDAPARGHRHGAGQDGRLAGIGRKNNWITRCAVQVGDGDGLVVFSAADKAGVASRHRIGSFLDRCKRRTDGSCRRIASAGCDIIIRGARLKQAGCQSNKYDFLIHSNPSSLKQTDCSCFFSKVWKNRFKKFQSLERAGRARLS